MKFLRTFLKKIPQHQRIITFSTWLTLVRIALTPVIAGAILMHAFDVSGILFLVAAITDFFDGFIARKYNQKTVLGACLDPIADKFLVIASFASLLVVTPDRTLIPVFVLCAMLVREILLIGGGMYLYSILDAPEIKPSWLGKLTTVLQMICIEWVLACDMFSWHMPTLYFLLLVAVLIGAGVSCGQYLYVGYQQVRRGMDENM